MVPSEPLLTSLSLMFPVITICLTIASTWLLWLPRHAPPPHPQSQACGCKSQREIHNIRAAAPLLFTEREAWQDATT